MPATTFRDLEVWKKAHQVVLGVYKVTVDFPRAEMFGLTSQLRRSVVSMPANIVEGFAKRGKPDKLRFYNIAQGSLEESRYYLILASDLGYVDSSSLLVAIDEVSRMLQAYINAIAASRR